MERVVNCRLAPTDQSLKSVAAVDDDVHPTILEVTKEGDKSDRLGQRLATQDRNTIARLANRIQQFLDDLVHAQVDAATRIVGPGYRTGRAPDGTALDLKDATPSRPFHDGSVVDSSNLEGWSVSSPRSRQCGSSERASTIDRSI